MALSSRSWKLPLVVVAVTTAACTTIAGVSDFRVTDDCLEGCGEGGPGSEGGPSGEGGPIDRDGSAPVDAPTDAPTDTAPNPAVGLSDVGLAGTGVLVGEAVVATVTVKDLAGMPVARTGAKVTFAFTGGTSVLTVGPVTDVGAGVYRARLTGVTEGTKVSVVASLDGVALTTAAPQVRVANAITTGLTFMLDAANADNAGNPGVKACPASAPTTWTDLASTHFVGTLTAFGDPCTAGSGWAGTGAPDDPYRIAFDGADDTVDFGAVNAIASMPPINTRQTILAWVRKTGAGTAGTSGFGNTGIPATYPIVAKGTAEGETTDIDIDYFLSITTGNVVGIDHENATNHGNNPFLGGTVIPDNEWRMIGYTFDGPAGSRVLYVNATADGSSVVTVGPSHGNNARLVIGGATTTTLTPEGRFKGDVALVMTYARALPVSELEKLCHAYSARFGMKSCPN